MRSLRRDMRLDASLLCSQLAVATLRFLAAVVLLYGICRLEYNAAVGTAALLAFVPMFESSWAPHTVRDARRKVKR